MNFNIIFKDFPKICRLCLSPGSLQPILETSILDVLFSIANIQVKDEDKLPENICEACIKYLEDIVTFIDKCKNNDETLRTIILNKYESSLAAEEAFDKHDQYDDDSSDNDDDEDDVKDDDDDSIYVKDEEEVENKETFFSHSIKEEFLDDSDTTDINLNKEGPVSCENCSENFSNREGLEEHYNEIVNCRPGDYNPTSSSVTNILDYLINNKNNKIHNKNEGTKRKEKQDDQEPEYIHGRKLKGKRRFLCSYCGKNYTRKNGLDRHMLSHSGVKPFECKECGKRYITKDTLKTHLLTHTGVRAHKCTICQKSFTQSSHLSYHMRRHSGDKPFSCAFCSKGFLSSYHLERHKLMHTGVKPFECELCGKQFVRGTTLRDHLFIHTGEKPFQCQHCGKQFNRKQSLTNHVLVHTGPVRSSKSSKGSEVNRGIEIVSLGNGLVFPRTTIEQDVGHSVYAHL